MFVDRVVGSEIYSAPNILGIRPHDWDRIQKETTLFTEAGQVWNSNWEKVVHLTQTDSKSTNKIIISSIKINKNGKRYRGFNLAFSDTAAYPIPTTNFDINFREFRFECSHMFTLEFPSDNNNSISNSNRKSNNNNNNNYYNNVVNFEDIWESCSDEVKSKLVHG